MYVYLCTLLKFTFTCFPTSAIRSWLWDTFGSYNCEFALRNFLEEFFGLVEWWCLEAQGRSPGRRELTQGVTLVASSGLRVQNSTAPPTIALRWGGGYYRARGELRDAVIQLTPEFGKSKFQTQSCIFLLAFNLFPWFKSVFGSHFWTFFFTHLWNRARWEKGGGHDSRLGPRSGYLREEQYFLI